MPQAECPYCEERVNFSQPARLREKLTCPHCGERLEVADLNPVVLDFDQDYYEDEDWGDDDWDDAD